MVTKAISPFDLKWFVPLQKLIFQKINKIEATAWILGFSFNNIFGTF